MDEIGTLAQNEYVQELFGISDMEQLVDKMIQISGELQTVSDKIKKIDMRMNTLGQHLTQCENLKQHGAVYRKYKSLAPKKCEAFYDKHFDKISSYESVKQYLYAILNGRKDIPIKAWQAEQITLTAERFSLCEDYYHIKYETRSVELL